MKKNVIENKSGKLDKLKWFAVGFLLLGALVANYYFATQALAVKIIVAVLIGFMSVGIAYTTQQGKQLMSFAREARTELRRVVWPTRQETVQTTIVVVAMVIFMGLLIWGFDAILLWLVGLLTGQRGL